MKLSDVEERVRADDARKWDLLLERDQLRFRGGRLRLPRSLAGGENIGGGSLTVAPTDVRELKLTPWAAGQMCQRLGIPSAYFRRCPPALQDAQVNHWLDESAECVTEEQDGGSKAPAAGQTWLLRAKGDTLRGVLSDRYAKLNNRDVLDCLLPLLRDAHFEVNWFAVTDESLHLRLFDPRLSREVLPGDRVMAGIHIGNSEVGKRAVTVDALVYRLVCENGLVRLVKGKSLLHHRHIGLSKGELNSGLLGSAVRDALTQSSGFMERLTQATREKVEDVDGVIATIATDAGLSQKTAEMVRAALIRESASQQETLFGLVNALTHTAQKLSPDDRYSLEALAGTILEDGAPRARIAVSPAPKMVRIAAHEVGTNGASAASALPSSPPPLALPSYSNGQSLSLFGP